jgi:hypothetical protein
MTAEAWVRARDSLHGVCGGQSPNGSGFLWVLRFSRHITPSMLHIHSCIIWGMDSGPVKGPVPHTQGLSHYVTGYGTRDPAEAGIYYVPVILLAFIILSSSANELLPRSKAAEAWISLPYTLSQRFDDPWYQRSALSALKHQGQQSRVCQGRCHFLCLASESPIHSAARHRPLQACHSTPTRSEFKWRGDNSATLFRPSWVLLCHTQAAPMYRRDVSLYEM